MQLRCVIIVYTIFMKSMEAHLNQHSKIGIFDSGLGGLSVVHTIQSLMPNESFVYIGDSQNAPYGTKDKMEVLTLSKNICDTFIEMDVKAIVVACNTATSAAINMLRDAYDIPIIGMEPAIKPALEQKEGKILVLATDMTLKEEKFMKLLDQHDKSYRVVPKPAPELVSVVENHIDDLELINRTVHAFLNEVEQTVEAVVLGCTHFIVLKDIIQAYFGDHVDIYDGNMGTAMQLKNILEANQLRNTDQSLGTIEIYNTKGEDFVEKSKNILSIFESRDTK